MLFLCAVSQSAALRRIESEGKRKEMVPMESSLQRTGRSIQDIYAAHADRVYRVA